MNTLGKDIFKNPEARERQEEWYQRFLVRADLKVDFDQVDTSFGEAHVLKAGNTENPPLICLHAMLTSSAHLLSEIRYLAENYHLIIPDIPGHSVKGIPERLSFKEDAHAQWLREVLDSYELESVDLLGVSLGGFVARQFASIWPERVSKLVLLVPAGIVQAPVLKGLMRMAIPMLKYKIKPSEENLRAVVDFLITNWDEDWGHYLGDSMNDFITPKTIPQTASEEELRDLTMPALVIGAEDDISFPGRELISRVEAMVPHAETELLEDTRHCVPTTEEFRRWLTYRITSFLEG